MWPASQRHLHAWTAALVLIGFSIAWIMVNLPFTQLLLKFRLYQAHKTIGLTVLALVCLRLVLRALWPRPKPDAGLPRWQLRTASGVHALLYCLLLAVPVLGYLTAATAPIGMPTFFLGLIKVPHLVVPDRESRFCVWCIGSRQSDSCCWPAGTPQWRFTIIGKAGQRCWVCGAAGSVVIFALNRKKKFHASRCTTWLSHCHGLPAR